MMRLDSRDDVKTFFEIDIFSAEYEKFLHPFFTGQFLLCQNDHILRRIAQRELRLRENLQCHFRHRSRTASAIEPLECIPPQCGDQIKRLPVKERIIRDCPFNIVIVIGCGIGRGIAH